MDTSDGQPAYRWVIVAASALILAVSMGATVNGLSAFGPGFWRTGDGALGRPQGHPACGAWRCHCAWPMLSYRLSGDLPVAVLSSVLHRRVLWRRRNFPAGDGRRRQLVSDWCRHRHRHCFGWSGVGPGRRAICIVAADRHLWHQRCLWRHWRAHAGWSGAPLACLLRNPPQRSAAMQQSDAAEEENRLPTTTVVVRMSAAITLCCICMSIPLMHLVPLIQDRGFSAEQTGSVIFVMLLVAIIGRLSFGMLAGRIGALPAYMTATAWMTLMVFGFIYVQNLGSFYAYAVIYGFGYADPAFPARLGPWHRHHVRLVRPCYWRLSGRFALRSNRQLHCGLRRRGAGRHPQPDHRQQPVPQNPATR